MNILFVFHERNNGGACKCALTLIDELKERGNTVHAIIPIRKGTLSAALQEHNIPFKVIFFGWWMMPEYWNWFMKLTFKFLYRTEGIAVNRIKKVIRGGAYDIVCSNSSAIDVGARAAKAMNIPHIWHIREYADADYSLEYILGRKKSCEYMCSVPGKLVFMSHALREHYKNDLPDKCCDVIYEGISRDFIYEKKYDFTNRKIVFLIAGNILHNKGQHQAIGAAEKLIARGCTNFKLLVGGAPTGLKASKEYANELRKRVEIYPDNIEFTGYINDIRSYRRNTDVELVCSASEAFGRVTVEAMMTSNVVIATDTGANPELIKDEETGFIYPNEDTDALADIMERIIKDPGIIAKIGSAAREYAATHFLSETGTEETERLYRELCDEKK